MSQEPAACKRILLSDGLAVALNSRNCVQVATLTATAHGCSANFTWDELPYPPTVNDVAMQAMVSALPCSLVLHVHLLQMPDTSV